MSNLFAQLVAAVIVNDSLEVARPTPDDTDEGAAWSPAAGPNPPWSAGSGSQDRI